MRPPAKTMYIGLDACDLHVAQQFAASGDMPTLARLLDTAAVVETVGPVGFFVSGIWPTIYTGTTPSRHGFVCSGRVDGGTYHPHWVSGPGDQITSLWDYVSREGMRVASLDAPHAPVARDLNGIQLVEWGAHDRHAGTMSSPAEFVDEVTAKYGGHLNGTLQRDVGHYAPCDYLHRKGVHRTPAENAALLADLTDAQHAKAAMSLDLLDRGGWDLFFTVLSETHCAGHQFWYIHDPTYPTPAGVVPLSGVDPLRTIYRGADRTLARHLERVDAGTTVYVHLSHGMRAHYDGQPVLDPVLWRLEQYAAGNRRLGWLSRTADSASAAMPRRAREAAFGVAAAARRRYAARVPLGFFDEEIPWIGTRRWWAQPNDTVSGCVRLNLEGREPSGRIRARGARDAACWLADRLLELVNLDTGERAVANVLLTDDYYERIPGDAFGDLIVEWNRDAPIEAVWSPATGVVRVPYEGWRSGDHHRGGLLLALGPGIAPGRRSERMPVVDVTPTVAASLGVELRDVDGIVRTDLVPHGPGALARPAPVGAQRPPLSAQAPVRTPSARRWSPKLDVEAMRWIEDYTIGLAGAHHHTALVSQGAHDAVTEMRAELDVLHQRVGDLDRLAAIVQVSSWLRRIDVPESMLVSVIMPTRNRKELLTAAVASVRRQSYTRWELLIVDDASSDGTWETLQELCASDTRIRPFRLAQQARSSGARNRALDEAAGDVVVYLDDDNRFDPDWCKAVVWTFTEHKEASVCYGARVVDDFTRHHTGIPGGMPWLQFNRWDRTAMEIANLVDMNVIAHRPSSVRFDESLDYFTDWDLLLQLTDDVDPVELPVIAAYYTTDAPDRLSHDFGSEHTEKQYQYIVDATISRRRGDG